MFFFDIPLPNNHDYIDDTTTTVKNSTSLLLDRSPSGLGGGDDDISRDIQQPHGPHGRGERRVCCLRHGLFLFMSSHRLSPATDIDDELRVESS